MIPVTLDRRQLPRQDRNPVSRDSRAPEWTSHNTPPARRARPAGLAPPSYAPACIGAPSAACA